MKRLTLLICAQFFSHLLFCQGITNRLDSLFKTYYKDQQPGAVIAIEYKGKIIFKKGYGLANVQAKNKIPPLGGQG